MPAQAPTDISQIPTQNWNGQLTKCGLNTFFFPVSHVEMTFSQRVVDRLYPNVPGADVESLSTNATSFRVRALFINGLKGFEDLFPETFISVVQLLNDKDNPGLNFSHPTLGNFFVKCLGGTTATDYNARNGQVIEFNLVVANTDQTTDTNVFGKNAAATSISTADSLDNNIQQYLSDFNPTALVSPVSITSLLNSIVSAVGQTTVQIGNLAAQFSDTQAAFQRTGQQLQDLGDPRTSFMQIQLQNLQNAVNQTVFAPVPGRKIFNVVIPMTLNNVLRNILKYSNTMTIESLLKLNPQLPTMPVIPAGNIVYFT